MSPHKPPSKTELSLAMSRRGFLKGVGAGVGASSLALVGGRCQLPPPIEFDDGNTAIPPAVPGDVERVIVIGAGFAGLAAANALAQAGVEVVVLEGRGRVGGRAQTVSMGRAYVDLGCAYIHGPIGNPLTRLSEQFSVGALPADLVFQVAPQLTGYESGVGPIGNPDTIAILLEFLSFESQIPSLLQSLGANASLETAIQAFLAGRQLPEPDRGRVEFALRFILESDLSGPVSEAALGSYWNVGTEFPGADVFPEGGYWRLVANLARGLDVRYAHEVTNVYSDGNGVVVRANLTEEPYEERVFQGSHVIVTVPLGVLKAGTIVFEPDLSALKRQAIENVGFGSAEKVALRFDEAFWTPELSHFVYKAQMERAFPLFLDFTTYYPEPVLLAHTYAAHAASLCGLPTEDIVGQVTAILEEVTGGPIPSPSQVAVSSWGQSRFTRGGYSFLPIGSSSTDMLLLGIPEADRILFAGEATYSERYGYSDGAFSSGVREAKRLLGQPSVLIGPLGHRYPTRGPEDLLMGACAALQRWRERGSRSGRVA